MVEVSVNDAVFREIVLAFDGRVLERFVPGIGGEGTRYHVRQIQVTVQPPNRKGFTVVAVALVGGRGGFDITVTSDELAALQPLLDELKTAGAIP